MQVSPVVRDIENSPWDEECEDEHLWWPRILWVDPGDVSGLAVVWFDPAALFAGKPTPRVVLAWYATYVNGDENDQAAKILGAVSEIGGVGLAVGIESFVVQQLNMDKSYLSPVRIRAKVEFGLDRGVKEQDGKTRRRRAFAQSSVDALTAITDARLKLWDMYTPGPDHIRDATRHCLLWLRRIQSKGIVEFRKAHGWEEGWFEDG